jgi:glycine C-acetyltransferase
MGLSSGSLAPRAERFVPRRDRVLGLKFPQGKTGVVKNVSRTGLRAECFGGTESWAPGSKVERLELTFGDERFSVGCARVVRSESKDEEGAPQAIVAFEFESPQPSLPDALSTVVEPHHYLISELRKQNPQSTEVNAYATTIDKFYSKSGADVFAKCESFRHWMDSMLEKQIYQRLYRLTVMGPLDNRVTVFDPTIKGERELICFDSNSYLGLHRHPKVIERVVEVTREVGYGTASAQLLCGTNRHLCELESALSELHGREATVVFPTGFAANIGAINGLIRTNDAVLRDHFAHASIHEGCRSSRARFNKVFPHNDMAALDAMLAQAGEAGCDGKLVVTDGVFSMHGRIAPLPELVEVVQRRGARLMLDDAHGVGVLGESGGGIEEHFGMVGAADLLMGTLSKALGALGGYVSGSRDVINYLRFFAPSGMFTTSLPAPLCAGLIEALRLIKEEPEHRQQLWSNIRYFVPALEAAGLIVPEAVSPITTVFMGDQGFMYRVSQELFDAGVKCGNVAYPAVPKGSGILRFTVNARHTREDLDYAIDALTRVGQKFGILHKSLDEIREIGRRIACSN